MSYFGGDTNYGARILHSLSQLLETIVKCCTFSFLLHIFQFMTEHTGMSCVFTPCIKHLHQEQFLDTPMSLNLFFQIIIMVMVVVVVDLMDDILLCSFVGWLISESPSNTTVCLFCKNKLHVEVLMDHNHAVS